MHARTDCRLMPCSYTDAHTHCPCERIPSTYTQGTLTDTDRSFIPVHIADGAIKGHVEVQVYIYNIEKKEENPISTMYGVMMGASVPRSSPGYMNIDIQSTRDAQMLKQTACMGLLQVELYKDVLRSKSVAALMSGRASEPSEGVLSIITSLRKLCNHPDLLYSSSSSSGKNASFLSASA